MQRTVRGRLHAVESKHRDELARRREEQERHRRAAEDTGVYLDDWLANTPPSVQERIEGWPWLEDGSGVDPEQDPAAARAWDVLGFQVDLWESGRPVGIPAATLDACLRVPLPDPLTLDGPHNCERCAYAPPAVRCRPVVTVCPLCGGRISYQGFRGDLRRMRRGELGRRTRAVLGWPDP